jgi:hypothetical protein
MAIETQDQLNNAMANNQSVLDVQIASITSVANIYYGLNRGAGTLSTYTNGALFSAGGEIPVGTTTAGFPYIPNAPVGKKNYLSKANSQIGTTGTIDLKDCLYRASGFNSTVITEQIIAPTAPTLTRGSANGGGNQIWIFCNTANGVTASNVTIKYINQDDIEKTTVARAVASLVANRLLRLDLATGDYGVKRIVSATLSASTGTAGDFSVMILKDVYAVGYLVANVGVRQGFNDCQLALIQDGCAMFFVDFATGTSTGQLMQKLNIISG